MVEYQIVALMVVGSSPIICPFFNIALLAELLDVLDLKYINLSLIKAISLK